VEATGERRARLAGRGVADAREAEYLLVRRRSDPELADRSERDDELLRLVVLAVRAEADEADPGSDESVLSRWSEPSTSSTLTSASSRA